MKYAAFFLALALLSSCGNGKVDTSQLKDEMKSREIRRISEADIIERTLILGKDFVKDLDAAQALSQSGGPIHIVKDKKGTRVARAYAFQYPNDLVEKEAAVFEAYRYNAENKLEAEPNAQKLPGDFIAYNAPIWIEGEMKGMWSVHFSRKFVVLSIED